MNTNQICLTKILQHVTKHILLSGDVKEIAKFSDVAISVSDQLFKIGEDEAYIEDEDYSGYQIIEDEGIAVKWVHDGVDYLNANENENDNND